MKTFAPLAALAAALLLPAAARGNCYYPDYQLTASGDDFHVCLTYGGRTCPNEDEGLLRRNTETGETVRITTCDEDGCFLDQCVPPGSYEYGLAVPYTCPGDRCGTVYYWPTTKAELSPTCTRTVAAPVPAAGVPWEGSGGPVRCGPDPSAAPMVGCSSAGAVFGLNGALLALGALVWRRKRRR